MQNEEDSSHNACSLLSLSNYGRIASPQISSLPSSTPLQTLVDPERRTYQTSSEMSIEFEVDGPYKASSFSHPAFWTWLNP